MRVLQDNEVSKPRVNFDYSPVLEFLKRHQGRWVEIDSASGFLPEGERQEQQTRLLQVGRARGMRLQSQARKSTPGKVLAIYHGPIA